MMRSSTIRLRASHDTEDQEGWLVSYADLITLLFIFFAVMLSISSVNHAKMTLLTQQFNHQSQSNISSLQKTIDAEIQKQGIQSGVATRISEEGLQIQFSEKVLFASGEADLNPEGAKALSQFARILSGLSQEFRLAVEGHTDSHPIHTRDFPSNWSLSAARSVKVLHFLSAHGVSDRKMMVRAYADTRPLTKNAAFNQDRRVTLLVY